MFNNNPKKIEYHTVGGESTNFYDQEHNLVTMLIANQENMYKVFKYFFNQGITCMRNRHHGERENFDEIFYKFNKMNLEEIDSKINPHKETEVIILDDDAASIGDASEEEIEVIECEEIVYNDPCSPTYNHPSADTEDSMDTPNKKRKRYEHEAYLIEEEQQGENDTTEIESESDLVRCQKANNPFDTEQDQLSKSMLDQMEENHTPIDTSIVFKVDDFEEEWKIYKSVNNITFSHYDD